MNCDREIYPICVYEFNVSMFKGHEMESENLAETSLEKTCFNVKFVVKLIKIINWNLFGCVFNNG